MSARRPLVVTWLGLGGLSLGTIYLIRMAGGRLLAEVNLFDVYTGEPIPPGKKSLAYSLTYRHEQRTLTDKEVAKVHSRIATQLRKALGAELRE